MFKKLLLSIAIILPAYSHADPIECKPDVDVTTINGYGLPAKMATLVNVTTMVDTVTDKGQRLVITKGTRLAGTRIAIHMHKYGGTTCVLKGALTDFVEGKAPINYPAGTCYYMPPNTPMTTTNLGTVDVVLQDIFMLPVGEPTHTIVEPGYPACN